MSISAAGEKALNSPFWLFSVTVPVAGGSMAPARFFRVPPYRTLRSVTRGVRSTVAPCIYAVMLHVMAARLP